MANLCVNYNLPPAYEVCGKVMFLLCLSVHRGVTYISKFCHQMSYCPGIGSWVLEFLTSRVWGVLSSGVLNFWSSWGVPSSGVLSFWSSWGVQSFTFLIFWSSRGMGGGCSHGPDFYWGIPLKKFWKFFFLLSFWKLFFWTFGVFFWWGFLGIFRLLHVGGFFSLGHIEWLSCTLKFHYWEFLLAIIYNEYYL